MKHCIIGLVLGMSVSLWAPLAHGQESLERGLLRQAPKLIKYFKDQDYKNVGVLKFRVSRDKPNVFTDNVGTINLLTAKRLELALLLANDPRTPVGIIDNASEVARTIPGASHLTPVGREKLFSRKYPLAWGKDTVEPDAFVTGTIVIGKDLRTLTVSLLCFDRAKKELIAFDKPFTVANSTDRLSEMGESFALRSVFEKGTVEVANPKQSEKVQQEAVYQKAAAVHAKKDYHPANPQSAYQPVVLEVLYDGVQVPYEFRDGKAYIPEPREGQTVQFGLRRDNSNERYGLVLKVNGENTLDRQRQPDLSCRKWVLGPGEGPWLISGFQIGHDKREKFRVVSVAESREREISYGPDVGTITMTVFREQKTKPRPMILSEDAQDEMVVKKLTQLAKRPDNYNALKAQFLEDANRGIFVAGTSEENKIQTATFNPDPTPIMRATIVYYRKQ